MAYAPLVSLAQTTNFILTHHQHSIPPQLKNPIESIHEYAVFLQAFLGDFPEKADRVEERIRKATHVAEDLIEPSLLVLVHMSISASKSQFLSSSSDLKSTFGSLRSKFKHKPRGEYQFPGYDLQELKDVAERFESIAKEAMEIKRELKDVAERFESIAKEAMEIKSGITVEDVPLGVASSSSTVALVHKEAVIGVDKDVMKIKSYLCGESPKLEVVSIVGMGGIGKTTLTKNVYEDQLILEYFEIRAWATVSQDYSIHDIVTGFLASMKGLDTKIKSTDALHVYQTLKGRRYLIVLDDIWSIIAWDDLKMMFPDDGNGSRIILTTRLSDVASCVNLSSHIHEMHLMDDDQSWILLRQRVFKQDLYPADLEPIGKMIAKNCKGLPLAIVVISGLLAADQTKAAWWNIVNHTNSSISANDGQLDKILSLSYKHLPPYLKPCFLYMGSFPEDYEVQVSKLIKLWVAEAFLKPNVYNKLFEDIAEEYLEDLVKRSLVFVNKRRSNGKIKSFSIHDVMREMCIRKAEEENFFLHVRGSPRHGSKVPRRISISYSDLSFLENYYSPTFHTMILMKHRKGSIPYYIERFRLLKTLDISNAYELFRHGYSFPSIPAQVFGLLHLRYLALDFPFSIPSTISNLENLQTLIIGPKTFDGLTDLFRLPMEIWKLPQLRHLIFCCRFLPFKEGAPFALENLQTLSGAINLICFEEILERIPNLIKLGLVYKRWDEFHEVFSYEEGFQLHNLQHLQKLENLKLEIDRNHFSYTLRKPSFPTTLKKLTLSGCVLLWSDMKIVGSLPFLEVLKLRDYACDGHTWETTEDEFSQLKYLLIDQSNLQNWITESSHFPKLKSLALRGCRRLREIPDGIGDIQTLELIEMDDRNEALVASVRQIQDYQQSNGNDDLQIRIIRELKSKDFMVLLRLGCRFDDLQTLPVYVGGEKYIFKYSNPDDVSLEYFKRIGERDGAEDPVRVYAKNGDTLELLGTKSDLVRLCKESLTGDKKVRLYIEGNERTDIVEEKDGGGRNTRVCCF